MTWLRILAALCAVSLSAVPGAARTDGVRAETLEYGAYIGGLPLGVLNLDIETGPGGYVAEGSFRMTTFLRLFLDTDARARAAGEWRGDRGVRPDSFRYWVRDRDETRNAEMRFDEAGDPVEVLADPPFRDKGYAMTLEEAAGAVDPATAAVVLTRARENACDVAVDVFDGQKRHRITLRPESQRKTREGSVRCDGRYDRIAGFKAKHMTPERRSYPFHAEFAPLPENRWRAVRLWADTQFGAATVVLRD